MEVPICFQWRSFDRPWAKACGRSSEARPHQQSAQSDLEVSLGEFVQVKLRPQLADFVGPEYETRPRLALEALFQVRLPRHFDRAPSIGAASCRAV